MGKLRNLLKDQFVHVDEDEEFEEEELVEIVDFIDDPGFIGKYHKH